MGVQASAEPWDGTLIGDTTLERSAAEHSGLTRFAYLLCGDRQRAENLVQDTLLAMHRRFGAVITVDNPVAYARRAIVNSNISLARRRWNHPALPCPAPRTATKIGIGTIEQLGSPQPGSQCGPTLSLDGERACLDTPLDQLPQDPTSTHRGGNYKVSIARLDVCWYRDRRSPRTVWATSWRGRSPTRSARQPTSRSMTRTTRP